MPLLGLGFQIMGMLPSLSSFPPDTMQAWLQARFSHTDIPRAWWEHHVEGTWSLSEQVEPSVSQPGTLVSGLHTGKRQISLQQCILGPFCDNSLGLA